jgi:hypothetical protein
VKGGSPKKPGDPPRKKPPRGRPPRHQGERLSKNRTFRVRGSLDEKLQAAAAASGRSVSEEIEFRLDQSFDRDAFIGVLLGSDENAKVLRSIAMVMKLESRSGHWLKDVNTVDTVRQAVDFIIRQFAQSHGPPPPNVSAEDAARTAATVQVLQHDQTPEALAYNALEMVRADFTRRFVRNVAFMTAGPISPIMPPKKENDETPGNDGETK